MDAACTIVTVERQPTAVIRAEAVFAELPQVQRAARARLGAVLPSLDAGPAGAACTRWTPPVGACGRAALLLSTCARRRVNTSDSVSCGRMATSWTPWASASWRNSGVQPEVTITIGEGWYSPSYGVRVPCTTLDLRAQVMLDGARTWIFRIAEAAL